MSADFPATIFEALQRQLNADPERVAFLILRFDGGQSSERTVTVGRLADICHHSAVLFRERGLRPGDRVVLSLEDPYQFLTAFFAVLAAGLIAVPLPALRESAAGAAAAAAADRIARISRSSDPDLILLDAAAPKGLAFPCPSLVWSTTGLDDIRPITAGRTFPQPAPDATAFLQYTSGSTNQPRGVVVTHENVVANLRGIGAAACLTQDDVVVSWLPLHHDMGLVGGVLSGVYFGYRVVLFAPRSFVTRPVRWLEVIHKYAATVTLGPPFAYNLCSQRLSENALLGLDLSRLRLAFIGAEMISPTTVDAFLRRFRSYGLRSSVLYPVYGLAEATLEVSAPEAGEEWEAESVLYVEGPAGRFAKRVSSGTADCRSYVCVGRPIAGHTVTIIDPDDGRELPERHVGEIVVRGPSVTARYHDEPVAHRRDRLHTGDLGYHSDGRLFVVDRLKDLLIVAGQNYAPYDLEVCLEEIAELAGERCAAVSLPAPDGTEDVHLLAELAARNAGRVEALRRRVRQLIEARVGLALASIVFVPRGTLPQTTSGKIQRRACRDLLASGELIATRFVPEAAGS